MPEQLIHPTAVIDPKAELHPTVRVGPFCVIEAGVRIGEGTTLGPQIHIQGLTTIGANNTIHTGATIGHPPQHVAYDGAASGVRIGDRNTIREYANINRGLHDGDMTTVGDDCFIMGFSHIGHDCHVGNRVILANGSLLAGHVEVGDRTFVSGLTGAHQFVRIGRMAMLGGLARVIKDVPPFMIIEGHPAFLRALNTVGMQRGGLNPAARKSVKDVFRLLYRSGRKVRDAIAEIDLETLTPEAREFVEFHTASKRGISPYGAYRKHTTEGSSGGSSADADEAE